jgi:hypothetical protein
MPAYGHVLTEANWVYIEALGVKSAFLHTWASALDTTRSEDSDRVPASCNSSRPRLSGSDCVVSTSVCRAAILF